MYKLKKNFDIIDIEEKSFLFSLDDDEILRINDSLRHLFTHFLSSVDSAFSQDDLKDCITKIYDVENALQGLEEILTQLISDGIIEKVSVSAIENTKKINKIEKIKFELPAVLEVQELSSVVEISDLAAFSFNLY